MVLFGLERSHAAISTKNGIDSVYFLYEFRWHRQGENQTPPPRQFTSLYQSFEQISCPTLCENLARRKLFNNNTMSQKINEYYCEYGYYQDGNDNSQATIATNLQIIELEGKLMDLIIAELS